MSEEKKLYKLFPEPVFKFKVKNYEKHNKELEKYSFNWRTGGQYSKTKILRTDK